MVNKNSIEKGPWLDGYLQSNLLTLKNSAIKGKYDNFIIISGMVGTGKTTLASQIAWNFNEEDTVNRGKDIFYFDMEQLSKDLQSFPKNSVFIIDEGGDTFMSSDTRKFLNNEFYRLLLKVRAKKHLIILVIPDFFDLRAGLATRRAFALLNCRLVPDEEQNMFVNGIYDFHNMDKMAELYWKGKKEHNYRIVQPNFWAGFGPWFPCNYDNYEKKKFDSLLIQEKKPLTRQESRWCTQRDLFMWKLQELGETHQQIADVGRIARQTVSDAINKVKRTRNRGYSLEK
ncbi:hypothetical protein LCGC14_0534650 [marine sediment metagenome]|uniref:AAA+ ATPase domain-containing protein n=1 Tax=marine sediment metagenome TaxID=412755 RepID=A0A0F9RZ88_9ZZZZ